MLRSSLFSKVAEVIKNCKISDKGTCSNRILIKTVRLNDLHNGGLGYTIWNKLKLWVESDLYKEIDIKK